jgi:mannose/cellobiose epimerase-like protein (N-acyl-D-glucosamine 2-epimerase family)
LRYRDAATGCLVDEGDGSGKIRKFTRRCWPQTEIADVQAESREQGAADEARAALVRLYKHYLSHPVTGGWYDQFDHQDRSLVDTIPASSFYHIVCAISEAERIISAV